jgi:hypothetical protein
MGFAYPIGTREEDFTTIGSGANEFRKAPC